MRTCPCCVLLLLLVLQLLLGTMPESFCLQLVLPLAGLTTGLTAAGQVDVACNMIGYCTQQRRGTAEHGAQDTRISYAL